MTNLAAMPYIAKTLKIFFSRTNTPMTLKQYVALGMGVLPKLFKLWPWIDLDPFYAKVKFGHIGFWMGKSENYSFFLETIAALGLKVAWSIQLNELMK